MQVCWNGQGAAKCGSILHSPLLAELAALEIVLQEACAVGGPVPDGSSEAVAGGAEQARGTAALLLASAEGEALDGWQSDCSSGVSDDECSTSGSVSPSLR